MFTTYKVIRITTGVTTYYHVPDDTGSAVRVSRADNMWHASELPKQDALEAILNVSTGSRRAEYMVEIV